MQTFIVPHDDGEQTKDVKASKDELEANFQVIMTIKLTTIAHNIIFHAYNFKHRLCD